MYPVSDRLALLSPSETLAMSQKSNELKAQGFDVINLSVGEPDFNTPDHIKEAAKQAVDNNFSFYSPVPGFPGLRNAICAKLKAENGLDYKPEQIVCSDVLNNQSVMSFYRLSVKVTKSLFLHLIGLVILKW